MLKSIFRTITNTIVDLKDTQGRRRRDMAFLSHVQGLAERRYQDQKALFQGARDGAPLLSVVVPLFNTKIHYLRQLLASIPSNPELQNLFEVIFVDDGSTAKEFKKAFRSINHRQNFKMVSLSENGGPSAAQNFGVKQAKGKYITILDHDDKIAPYGLEMVLFTLITQPAAKLVYTDEVIINAESQINGLFLKPAWDPVLLSGVNYVNHFTIFKRDLLLADTLYQSEYDGSHDYDILLRYASRISEKDIYHLPYPAYYWRELRESFSKKYKKRSIAAARKALANLRSSDDNEVFLTNEVSGVDEARKKMLHKIRFSKIGEPKVSVIIPMKDRAELTDEVARGLLTKTNYKNIDVLIIDNGSVEAKTQNVLDTLTRTFNQIKILRYQEPFNFSRLINIGVQKTQGDYILALNNDIEIMESEWLNEMLECFGYDNVGIVGAKLLYPDHRIQHAGVVVGFGELAGHWYHGEPRNYPGPMGRLFVRQTMSAVTGACMLFSRACFNKIGGFDEKNFAVAYNDVDFCLRARKYGYKVIWTPFAELIHHESATRGSDEKPDKIDRFRREQKRLKAVHSTGAYLDPTINPWFTRDRSNPQPFSYTSLMEPRTNAIPGIQNVSQESLTT